MIKKYTPPNTLWSIIIEYIFYHDPNKHILKDLYIKVVKSQMTTVSSSAPVAFGIAFSTENLFNCIMLKTEISIWFGLTATEKKQTKEYKVLRYLVQFFISILFIPNVSELVFVLSF